MARFAGVDLPKEKRIEIGLTYLYGIGRNLSRQILMELGINLDTKVKDLGDDDINKLRNYLNDKVKFEGELRTEVSMNIKRLVDINCYRGTRHRKKLPSRGQRTRTNSRTRRTARRMAIAKKKKV